MAGHGKLNRLPASQIKKSNFTAENGLNHSFGQRREFLRDPEVDRVKVVFRRNVRILPVFARSSVVSVDATS